MKKIILRTTGKEVKKGELISKSEICHIEGIGNVRIVKTVAVNENTLPMLIEAGIVFIKDDEGPKVANPKMSIDYYIEKIANRLDWNIDKTYNYLNNVDMLHPSAALCIILREIAIELDKKYEDHIENSPTIYCISMLDGRIHPLNKATIKNYRNFAAFRTIEDAKIACNITRDILKELFKSGK